MNYEAIAFWSQMVAFVLFVAAIIWVWQKSIEPAVASAQKASNERIALAERHRDEMLAAVETLKGGIQDAQRDGELMKERVVAQSTHERDAILADAKAAGERALKNAGGELDRARAAARESMRGQLAERALQIARGEAARSLDDGANARLVKNFVSSLERNESGNASVTN